MNISRNGITLGLLVKETQAESSHYSPLKKTFPEVEKETSELTRGNRLPYEECTQNRTAERTNGTKLRRTAKAKRSDIVSHLG